MAKTATGSASKSKDGSFAQAERSLSESSGMKTYEKAKTHGSGSSGKTAVGSASKSTGITTTSGGSKDFRQASNPSSRPATPSGVASSAARPVVASGKPGGPARGGPVGFVQGGGFTANQPRSVTSGKISAPEIEQITIQNLPVGHNRGWSNGGAAEERWGELGGSIFGLGVLAADAANWALEGLNSIKIDKSFTEEYQDWREANGWVR